MTEPHTDFSLDISDANRAFALSLLRPDVLKLNQRQREEECAYWVFRHCLFTGGGGVDGLNSSNGFEILSQIDKCAGNNGGLGPVLLCSQIAYGYIALCAACGIYARWIAAVGPNGPDNQAEYWDELQESWVFRNIGCHSLYVDPATGNRLSYISLLNFSRSGEISHYHLYSPTGNIAIHQGGERYALWEHHIYDAVLGNGNRSNIGLEYDWQIFRVAAPKEGVATVHPAQFLCENVSMHICYPNMAPDHLDAV